MTHIPWLTIVNLCLLLTLLGSLTMLEMHRRHLVEDLQRSEQAKTHYDLALMRYLDAEDLKDQLRTLVTRVQRCQAL